MQWVGIGTHTHTDGSNTSSHILSFLTQSLRVFLTILLKHFICIALTIIVLFLITVQLSLSYMSIGSNTV